MASFHAGAARDAVGGRARYCSLALSGLSPPFAYSAMPAEQQAATLPDLHRNPHMYAAKLFWDGRACAARRDLDLRLRNCGSDFMDVGYCTLLGHET